MSSGGVHLTLRPQIVEYNLFSYSEVFSAEGTEHPNKEGQKAGDLYLLATQGQNASGAFTSSAILVSSQLCILRMKTSYSKTNYASKPDHKCKHSGLHQVLWSHYLSNMGFG